MRMAGLILLVTYEVAEIWLLANIKYQGAQMVLVMKVTREMFSFSPMVWTI